MKFRFFLSPAVLCAGVSCWPAHGELMSLITAPVAAMSAEVGIATTDELRPDFAIPPTPSDSLPPTISANEEVPRSILDSVGEFAPGHFKEHVESKNGKAGARLLDRAFADINPQELRSSYPHQAEMLDVIDTYLLNDDTRSADELSSHVAGAGVANLSMALSGRTERYLRNLAYRSGQGLGAPSCWRTTGQASAGAKSLPPYLVWAEAEMDYHKLDGSSSAPGYTLNSLGGSAGMAALIGSHLTLGASLAGSSGKLRSNGYGSKASGHADVWYAGVSMHLESGCWQHTLVGTIGLADLRLTRSVYLPTGYRAHGSTHGLGLGFMYETSRTFDISEEHLHHACWQPFLNVAFVHSRTDSFTEHGSDAALHVAAQNNSRIVLALGARLLGSIDDDVFNTPASFHLRLLGKATLGDRHGEAEVQLPGVQTRAVVQGASQSIAGLELGGGLQFPIGNQSAFYTDISASFSGSDYSWNGVLGYRLSF